LPLEGLTRSAQREAPYCFHADSPIEHRRNSPIECGVTGRGGTLPSNSAEYAMPAASGARGSSVSGAPA
jgi:hypothetical protein